MLAQLRNLFAGIQDGPQRKRVSLEVISSLFFLVFLCDENGFECPFAFSSTGRSLIFVAGGVTFAEMHFVSAVSETANKEIILGGTSLLTPSKFLAALREL